MSTCSNVNQKGDGNCNRKEVKMFDWIIDIIRDMQKSPRVEKIRDRKSKKRE